MAENGWRSARFQELIKAIRHARIDKFWNVAISAPRRAWERGGEGTAMKSRNVWRFDFANRQTQSGGQDRDEDVLRQKGRAQAERDVQLVAPRGCENGRRGQSDLQE